MRLVTKHFGFYSGRCWVRLHDDEPEVDEAALEDWEDRRRERIAERNEY